MLLLREYNIKAYNDGVSSLPPLTAGFRHPTRHPGIIYCVRGKMYRIPDGIEADAEAAYFKVHDQVEGEDEAGYEYPRSLFSLLILLEI